MNLSTAQGCGPKVLPCAQKYEGDPQLPGRQTERGHGRFSMIVLRATC